MTENEKQTISKYLSDMARSNGYEAEDLLAHIKENHDADFIAAFEVEYKKIMGKM